VKTLGTPVRRTEPKTPEAARAAASQEGGIHAVKAAERAGNARSTGACNVIGVAEVGRTHRASRPPGGRKASWWTSGALAGRKLEAPPDAGHEPVEGETVLRVERSLTSVRSTGIAGFGSRVFDTTEGALGLSPALPLPARRSEALGSEVNLPHASPRGARDWSQRVGRHRGRSGVPTGDDGSIRGRGGFGEGSTRSEKDRGGSASSDAEKAVGRVVRRNACGRS